MARPRRARRWTAIALAAAVAPLAACSGINVLSREPERSVDAFCAQVKTVKDFDAVLATGDVARINHQLDDLRTLQQVSPPDIEPQVATLVGITEELSRTVATAKDPDLAANEVFARHQGDLASITAAGEAVQHYSADHCQVALNGTAGTGTTIGTAAPTTTTTAKAPATTKAPTTKAPVTTAATPKSSPG